MHQQINYLIMMEAAAAYIEKEKPHLRKAEDVVMMMRPLLQDKDQEELWALYMNTRMKLISMKQVTVGLATNAQYHAREVFREAITQNACFVILVHNHPSGDPMPSPQDVGCTKGASDAGKIIGIELRDHVIIGRATNERPRDFISMRELNLI